MKNIKNDPKNNLNSEYEREKYLKMFGESPIFFWSILMLGLSVGSNFDKTY